MESVGLCIQYVNGRKEGRGHHVTVGADVGVSTSQGRPVFASHHQKLARGLGCRLPQCPGNRLYRCL